jgi:DNA polymerase elongation subunit (family B)
LVFDKYDYIFNDFVDYFTEIREKSDVHKIFGKLMINSLYGRMGMSSIDNYSFIIKEEDLENYEYLNIISMKKVNKIILLNIELDNKIKNSIKKINYRIKKNISIASSITSKSRIKLYKAQKEVIKNKGRLLYSDTDSIFAAYKRDVSGEKQGEIF